MSKHTQPNITILDIVSCSGNSFGLEENLQAVAAFEAMNIDLQCPVCIPHKLQKSISYEWYKDGVQIPGEDCSSLQLWRAQISESGYYQCVAVGPGRNVYSNEALVTIKGNVLQDRSLHV